MFPPSTPKLTRWAWAWLSVSAIAVAAMLIGYIKLFSPRFFDDPLLFAACLSPFLLAGCILFTNSRPRFVWITTLIGAGFPLLWIRQAESRVFGNSWIALNASDQMGGAPFRGYAELRIGCATVLVLTLVWGSMRLFLPRWEIPGIRLKSTAWPSLVLTIVVIGWWFAASAFPYRQPAIVDAVTPELSLLYVQKNGFAFHETGLRLYRDGRFWTTHDDRFLCRYRFEEVAREGFLTEELRTQLKTIEALPDLRHTEDRAPAPLRSFQGEAWYAEKGRAPITAFTPENKIPAPPELVAFFQAILAIPAGGPNFQNAVRDVCLGFCYDPKAGLGQRAENQRCVQGLDHKERCD
jgi:hypothetical protein